MVDRTKNKPDWGAKIKEVTSIKEAAASGKSLSPAAASKLSLARAAEPGRRPSPAEAASVRNLSPAAVSTRRRPSQRRSGLHLKNAQKVLN